MNGNSTDILVDEKLKGMSVMKKFISLVFLISVTTLTLPGCATSSGNPHAPYVLPSQFQTYTCDELLAEIDRIQNRVIQLTGKSSDNNPTKDKWTLGTDLSLSWAALFALSDTKEQEAEYVQLKSEYDALQHWAVTKKCPGAIPADQPPEFDPNLVEESHSETTRNRY